MTTAGSDEQLFQLIATGDEQAFRTFYDAYRPQFRGFAQELTGSDNDADDVLQETFLRIWLSRDKLVDIENPRAWVFTINARVCLNWLRRQQNQRKRIQQISIEAGETLPTPFDMVNLRDAN